MLGVAVVVVGLAFFCRVAYAWLYVKMGIMARWGLVWDSIERMVVNLLCSVGIFWRVLSGASVTASSLYSSEIILVAIVEARNFPQAVAGTLKTSQVAEWQTAVTSWVGFTPIITSSCSTEECFRMTFVSWLGLTCTPSSGVCASVSGGKYWHNTWRGHTHV